MKDLEYLDIAFEHGIKLDKEDKSRGNYPKFDGAILLRHRGAVVLLVIELKFKAKGGRRQIEEKKHIHRARSFFEKRNPGVVIEREIGVCFNLFLRFEVKVLFEKYSFQ